MRSGIKGHPDPGGESYSRIAFLCTFQNSIANQKSVWNASSIYFSLISLSNLFALLTGKGYGRVIMRLNSPVYDGVEVYEHKHSCCLKSYVIIPNLS